MGNIQSIANCITGHTHNHILVKGRKSDHNRVISALANEMREFLTEKKGQEIHPDEITGFFSFKFPKLNVEVTAEKAKNIAGQLIQNFDNSGKIQSFMLTISPTKHLAQTQNVPRIRVDSDTADSLIHEGTHLFQSAIKSEFQIHNTKMKKLLSEDEMAAVERSLNYFFHEYVYFDADGHYIRPLFSAQVNKVLENLSNGDERLHLEFLRIFIREAEREKQAFELGQYETKMFNSPILKRFKWYQNAVRDKVNQEVERNKHLGDKIATLKEDYFALAKKIHDKRLSKAAKNN